MQLWDNEISREYQRILSKYAVALTVKLSEPKGDPASRLHIASGFVFDGGIKQPFPVLATVKHFTEKVVDWNERGWVQELKLSIRSAEDESELISFDVPVHEIRRMFCVVDESLDLAAIPIPHELEQIMSRHDHRMVRVPKSLDAEANKTACVVVGMNAGSTTVYQHSVLWLPTDDGFQPTARSSVGTCGIRTVQIKCSSGDDERLILRPLESDAPSVVGMSGGPVLWLTGESDIIFVGQQIAQKLDRKSQEVEYLVANPMHVVIPAIVRLTNENLEHFDHFYFFPKHEGELDDSDIPF